ncbi:Bug family tripartite tricarboxylate transporter substrate binding protein [Rhodoplanes sp. Z2-YC6860]|uniref:Bug family tripartite tricarboxylate transporter substrate binding protein n=1 Tax=Rhodoplanes sp. Z2-YC6860 TaxID=674703 RepID=UPI00078BA09B|nr:tripartite tricarboxylate transporter substrate binding protein [Rhodoplanes sp. Z2-YC6860]AMN42645.1 extra-cytoplasmic solute receptor protein [Rhodoplanes sp. Z2-YC6860]
MKRFSLLAALLLAAGLVIPAYADPAYPTRPVQIVVPYPPGGLTDVLTRAVAERLSKTWPQPVITMNRPGANGGIATLSVAKAPADGYTLLFGTDATLATNLSLYPSVGYDPIKDFAPITTLGTYQLMLVVNKDVPARNFAEFIEYARNHQPPLNFGSVGIGSAHHLAMEMLKSLANINLVHVPYRGGAPATLAQLTGEIPVMFNGPASIKEHVEAGKLRVLAVTGKTRSPAFPDAPTIAESGYPTFNIVNWYGLLAPAGTSPEIVEKVRADVAKVMEQQEFKDWMAKQGIEPLVGGPAEFSALVASEIPRLGAVVKASGAKLE